MKAILISAGVLSVVETPGKLEDLQRYVDGYIEAGFTVDSPDGKRRSITGYVDEEGLINGKERNFIGVEVGEFKNAFVGPVIIIGLDERTGETVGLSETEIAAVTLSEPRILHSPHLGILLRVPVIEINTKKAKKAKKAPAASADDRQADLTRRAGNPLVGDLLDQRRELNTSDEGPGGDFLG